MLFVYEYNFGGHGHHIRLHRFSSIFGNVQLYLSMLANIFCQLLQKPILKGFIQYEKNI